MNQILRTVGVFSFAKGDKFYSDHLRAIESLNLQNTRKTSDPIRFRIKRNILYNQIGRRIIQLIYRAQPIRSHNIRRISINPSDSRFQILNQG